MSSTRSKCSSEETKGPRGARGREGWGGGACACGEVFGKAVKGTEPIV